MSDLIKREDAIKAAEDGMCTFYDCYVIEKLKEVPSAEPKKVCIGQIRFDDEKLHEIVNEEVKKLKEEMEPKHGEWIFQECNDEFYGRAYECSICGVAVVGNHHNFCPNCGCRMKGADDE